MQRCPLLFVVAAVMVSHTTRVAGEDVSPFPSGKRTWVQLSGTWQTRANQGRDFQFPPPDDGWQPIEIPSPGGPFLKLFSVYESNISALLDKQGQPIADKASAWYLRRFTLPAGCAVDKHAILRFEGMAFKSAVWLNGKPVGRSLQGMIPLEYDVTDVLREGENDLVVGLTNRTGLVDVQNNVLLAPSRGISAGIWGQVTLTLAPEMHIEDLYVKTFVNDRRIEFDVTVTNTCPRPRTITPKVLITDKKGAPETMAHGSAVTIPAEATKALRVRHDWVAPILWSPDTPALYFAHAQLWENGAAIDETQVRFGFREFEVRGKRFYLNGRPITLLRGTSLTPASTRYTAVAIGDPRTGGFRRTARQPYNAVRMHIGFINQYVMDWADELGVMIVPEMSPSRGEILSP